MSTNFRGASGSSAWEWTNCKWGGAFHKKRATATETDRLLIAFMVVLLIWIWIKSRKFDLLLWHSNTWYFGEEDGSPLLVGCVARDMPLFLPPFSLTYFSMFRVKILYRPAYRPPPYSPRYHAPKEKDHGLNNAVLTSHIRVTASAARSSFPTNDMQSSRDAKSR